MEHKNVLGMICGYYLSRFDKDAYGRLGYETQTAAHKALSDSLSVPPDSIKNWRDEFDPVHDNPRQGWHKREMYASRKRVIEAFGNLSEPEIFAIISSIIQKPTGKVATEIIKIVNEADESSGEKTVEIGIRGLTGIKAESTFMYFYEDTGLPMRGFLRDCRYEQCGYDFAIDTDTDFIAIEVKGLAGQEGGVSFTDKEWRVAEEMGNCYYLALVRNILSEPEVSIFQNPAAVLKSEMQVYTTVQVSWSVSHSALRSAEAEQTR